MKRVRAIGITIFTIILGCLGYEGSYRLLVPVSVQNAIKKSTSYRQKQIVFAKEIALLVDGESKFSSVDARLKEQGYEYCPPYNPCSDDLRNYAYKMPVMFALTRRSFAYYTVVLSVSDEREVIGADARISNYLP